jgi:hypothetical protein
MDRLTLIKKTNNILLLKGPTSSYIESKLKNCKKYSKGWIIHPTQKEFVKQLIYETASDEYKNFLDKKKNIKTNIRNILNNSKDFMKLNKKNELSISHIFFITHYFLNLEISKESLNNPYIDKIINKWSKNNNIKISNEAMDYLKSTLCENVFDCIIPETHLLFVEKFITIFNILCQIKTPEVASIITIKMMLQQNEDLFEDIKKDYIKRCKLSEPKQVTSNVSNVSNVSNSIINTITNIVTGNVTSNNIASNDAVFGDISNDVSNDVSNDIFISNDDSVPIMSSSSNVILLPPTTNIVNDECRIYTNRFKCICEDIPIINKYVTNNSININKKCILLLLISLEHIYFFVN